MADGPEARTDPQWPKLVSLSAHELRSPLSVVAGYIRMLLQERAGPLGDQQRRLLEEAEKSCGRLSQLVAELAELSQLESGTATFNRGTVNLKSILAEAIACLPDLPDRAVAISLTVDPDFSLRGDASRLRTAMASILLVLRRELVTGDHLAVRVDAVNHDALRITIGDLHRLDELHQLEPAVMATFDEWRGGNGLSLPNARRVIEAHGGRLWSPCRGSRGDEGAAAIIMLPTAG